MTTRAEFTLNSEDILTASRMVKGRVARLATAFFIVVFIVGTAFGRGGRDTDSLTFSYMAVCVVVATGALFLGLEWDFRRKARAIPKDRIEIEITDDWFEIKSGANLVRNTWDGLRKASLDRNGVLLYWRDGTPFFIPARAFLSGYPRAELKSLLQRKLRRA
jgi:hypothetical protein